MFSQTYNDLIKKYMLFGDLNAYSQLTGNRTDDAKGKILFSQMEILHLLIVNNHNRPATLKMHYTKGWLDVILTLFEIFSSFQNLKPHIHLLFFYHRLVIITLDTMITLQAKNDTELKICHLKS